MLQAFRTIGYFSRQDIVFLVSEMCMVEKSIFPVETMVDQPRLP
jgi:hypothetical protein